MGRRRRGYAQLSNGFFEDTKIRKALKVNPRAGLLFVMSIAFSSSNLTDGHITVDDAEYVLGASQDDIGYLTAEGLWVESGDGWDIHNYLKYNLSSDRVMSRLEADKSRKSISVRNPDGKGTESVRNPDDFRADVNKEQRTNNQELNNPCCCSIDDSNNARAVSEENNNNNDDDSPQPEGTTIPPDWKPDPEDARYAMLWRLDPRKTGRAFRDYHLRHGTKSHDWHAMFRGWVQRNPEARQPPDSS